MKSYKILDNITFKVNNILNYTLKGYKNIIGQSLLAVRGFFMKRIRLFTIGILILGLIFGFVLAGCSDDDTDDGKEDPNSNPGNGGNTAVTFSSVTANGSSSQTTTELTLTFSAAITGLSAADITLSGVSGVIPGTLSGSGSAYTLPISGLTGGGTLSVTVTKSGYDISGSPKTVAIYYYSYSGGGNPPPPSSIAVTLSSVTADGSTTETTTELTLTFSRAITGLSAADITLSGVSGVSKGTLSGSGATYTLEIDSFTSSGTLSVAVMRPGYSISGVPKTVPIYYINSSGDTVVTLLDVTADGSSSDPKVTTTELTLTFSLEINGLSANDITLNDVTGVTKGTLSGSGPAYTLPINGFTSGGTLSVAVSKAGYSITSSPKTVTIVHADD